MELATSIRIEDGLVVATTVVAKRSIVHLSSRELATRGIPQGYKLRAVGAITTDLSIWKAVTFDEYAHSMAPGTGGSPLAHDAWTFIHGGRRYVVPALVLMRAMVQFDAELFTKLFQPQSLEDVCCPCLSEEDSCARVNLSSKLKGAQRRTTPGLLALMTWLYFFPSARRFWASAYQSAKKGQIGLALPAASLTFTVYGVQPRTSGNVYVTRLSLVEIEAQEAPLPFAPDQPRKIIVRPLLEKSEAEQEAELALETRLELDESVWSAVEPLLARSRGRGSKADHRKVLSCVLQVQLVGSTWNAASRMHKCPIGSAADALARWRQDGRWDVVTRELRRLGVAT